LHNYPLNVD